MLLRISPKLNLNFSVITFSTPLAALSRNSRFCNVPSTAPFITANIPEPASEPKIFIKYCSFVASPMPSMRLARACINSGISRSRPCASVAFIPNSPRAFATALGSRESLLSAALKAVPACEPLIPALAITPIMAFVCSMEMPSPEAIGATYFIASPSSFIPVLLAALVCAKTSATRFI